MKDNPCYQCGDIDGPTDGIKDVVCSGCFAKYKKEFLGPGQKCFYPWIIKCREERLAQLGQFEASKP
jgi:hypothetical protein